MQVAWAWLRRAGVSVWERGRLWWVVGCDCGVVPYYVGELIIKSMLN